MHKDLGVLLDSHYSKIILLLKENETFRFTLWIRRSEGSTQFILQKLRISVPLLLFSIWAVGSSRVLYKVNRVLNFILAIVHFRVLSRRTFSKQQLLVVFHIKHPLARIYLHDLKYLYTHKIVNGHNRCGDILHELFIGVPIRFTRSNNLFVP